MKRIPIITGLGLITALGNGVDETWRAVLEGRFIRDHTSVPLEFEDDRPRVFHLAGRVAREATAQARWDPQQMAEAVLVVATSKGSIASWSTALPSVCGLSDVADFLSHELKMGYAPRLTLSAACASGLHGMIRAAMMIRAGEIARVLVVAVESSVQDVFIGSFNRLGVLSQSGHCRPFDRRRDGFLMSEAAAAVCLEAVDSDDVSTVARERNPAPAVMVERFALGGDAHHLTATDPDGKLLKHLLNQVIGGRPVDLIHAHGTGTEMNDIIELSAIESCFADSDARPSVFSHKAALGHSQGAAGLVSVVLNCLSHQHQIVPPNVLTCEPLATSRVKIARELEARPIRRSIAISSGFGGATGVVSLVQT